MGSYMVRSVLLLNDGVLYKAELWDRDYEGDVWHRGKICEDLPCFNLPLFIQNNKIEKVTEVLKNNSTLKDVVKALSGRKILSYVSLEEAADILFENFLDKMAFVTKKKSSQLFDVKRLCYIFQIGSDFYNEYFFNGKKVSLICPAYILFGDQEKYYPLFWDEVCDITLSLDGSVTVIKNKEIIKDIVKKSDGNHRLRIFY